MPDPVFNPLDHPLCLVPRDFQSPAVTWSEYVPFAFGLMDLCRPGTLVELGTIEGVSYCAFCQAVVALGLDSKCQTTGIGLTDEEVFTRLRQHHDPRYGHFSRLLREPLATTDFALESIDLLHFAGGVSDETGRTTYEHWRPRLSPRAVVLLTGIKSSPGIASLWTELSAQHPSFALTHGPGLGVLAIGPDVPAGLRSLLSLPVGLTAQVQQFFHHLGEQCLEQQRATLAAAYLRMKLAEQDQRLAIQTASHREQRVEHILQLAEMHDLNRRLSRLAVGSVVLRAVDHLGQALTSPRVGWECYFDTPLEWENSWSQDEITGWIVPASGVQMLAICARHGRKVWRGTIHWPRSHSASARPPEHADRIRFTIGFRRPVQTQNKLRLEVLLADGRWVIFARRTLIITKPGSGARVNYNAWRAEDALVNPPLPSPVCDILLSLLLPLSPTPEAPGTTGLNLTLASLLAQTYLLWELCVAYDGTTAPSDLSLLQDHAKIDPRIKLVPRAISGGRVGLANAAGGLVTGNFAALLDPDAELPPHALAEVARTLAAHPRARLLYTDEDQRKGGGDHTAPCFKPDWMPDLLLGADYFGHLAFYQTALWRELAGYRTDFTGAETWDLALRATERLAPDQIVHVPQVLYHARAAVAPVVAAGKPLAAEAGCRARREHLARTGQLAEMAQLVDGSWRVRPLLPAPVPRVSLIIPTRNRCDLLRTCVESIFATTTYPDYELIIVDNGSDEAATVAYLHKLRGRGVKILHDDGPFNYAALNNRAAAQATGEVLGLLNNDLEVITPGWLQEMVAHALRPGVGAVGAMLYYPDNRIQHAGVVLGIAGPNRVNGIASHAFKYFPRGSPGDLDRLKLVQNYSAVTAACLVIRREVFAQVGGFDADSFAVAFNDVDLCLRLRAAGYRNVWTPFAELYHHESASRGTDDTPAKKARFDQEGARMRARWGKLLAADPSYNPNLTLVHEDFSLAWPPRLQ